MQKLYAWLIKNSTIILTAFALAFIPLYPKLPLMDIFGTWVYIRFEDILVMLILGIQILSIFKNRQIPKTPLTAAIGSYWAAGLLSLISSLILIGPHLSNYFPHLAILHYIRRIEYMALFFCAFSAMKDPKKLKVFTITLAFTAFAIVLYGFGQKFFGFPAFLTMNEEFAKGIPLRLPSTARIPSTFGGHYDLAAYIVLTLPVLASLIFGVRKMVWKMLLLLLSIGLLILLLFTASRISFGVYLVAVSAMLIWQKKPLLIIPTVIASVIILNFVSGASERFYKTFRMSDVIVDLSTGKPIGTLEKLEGGKAVVEKELTPDVENLPKGSEFVNLPNQSSKPTKTIKTIEYLTSKTMATGSGEIATISGSFLIQKALVYDISITTRFQGEWPNAIAAFRRNILLGSGYSTLNVAVDGDYLRMLGETGLIGSAMFISIFILAFSIFLKLKDKLTPIEKSFVIGVFAGIVGLSLNAILIDVFEASKVAYTLWLLLGIAMAVLSTKYRPEKSYLLFLITVFTSQFAFILYITVLVFVIYGRALPLYFIGDDFTWLRWAASTATHDVVKYFTDARGFFYRPIPKLWYFVLYMVFWLKPFAYHLLSVTLFAGITTMLFGILKVLKIHTIIALATTVFFAVSSIHHENVFWVSGQSSLLSAFFATWAVFCFIRYWQKNTTSYLTFMFGWFLAVLSMLSYEGAMALPILLWFIGFIFYKQRTWRHYLLLLLVPLYVWLRTYAQAVPAEGDYGVNIAKFIPNFIGNSIGYFLSYIFGYPMLEKVQLVRTVVRPFFVQISFGFSLFLLVLGYVFLKTKIVFRNYLPTLYWIFAALISLMPFLGLGGLSERYLLLGSVFFSIAGAVFINTVMRSGRQWLAGILIACVLCNAGFEYRNLIRVADDWESASRISNTSLLAIHAAYFPLTADKTFIFINPPIRYGRAWVFPTGLTDALWHMFRFNPYQFEAPVVHSEAEAFAYPVSVGYADRFFFENMTLKMLEKKIETIESEE